MSLFPARTREEAIWQNCNYGYDTSKYKSFEDCMTKQGLNINFQKPANQTSNNVTSTPVLCKDGTTKNQLSSPTGRYSDACMNNGGRAENQPVAQAQSKSPTKSGVSIFKKLAGAYNENLIIAVVLVAGYFAYKKYKK
jgi:Tfp pilus assembly protein PilX